MLFVIAAAIRICLYSFCNQRININATTCKSTYEWRFSLHWYDLIKSKYSIHFLCAFFSFCLLIFRLIIHCTSASNGVPPTVSKRILLAVNCKFFPFMLHRKWKKLFHRGILSCRIYVYNFSTIYFPLRQLRRQLLCDKRSFMLQLVKKLFWNALANHIRTRSTIGWIQVARKLYKVRFQSIQFGSFFFPFNMYNCTNGKKILCA